MPEFQQKLLEHVHFVHRLGRRQAARLDALRLGVAKTWCARHAATGTPRGRPLEIHKERKEDIHALTGLRFLAAISVAVAHGASLSLRTDGGSQYLQDGLRQAAGFGMTLFFVLSGFVIHYNYRTLIREQRLSGVFQFLWARFARLYPLFFLVLLIDVLLGHHLFDAVAGDPTEWNTTLAA